MSLIFDGFKTRRDALEFARAVASRYQLPCRICDNQLQSDAIDPFPYELTPPIVLVDRSHDQATEANVEKLVGRFHGSFAGT